MDIPALNTLILASPKSDVEQSVGRILRKKHEGADPLLVDIADDFSVFRNQAIKRKRFYHRQGFDVFLGKIRDDNELTRKMAYQKSSVSFSQEIKKKRKSQSEADDLPAEEEAPSGCLIGDSDED